MRLKNRNKNSSKVLKKKESEHIMTRKTIEPKVKIFSCFECGHPYKAFSPDSSFKYAYISPCPEINDLEPNHNDKQPNPISA